MMLLGYVPEFLMKSCVALPKTPQFSALNKKPTKQRGVSYRFFFRRKKHLDGYLG